MIISMLITFKTSINKKNIQYVSNLDLFCEKKKVFSRHYQLYLFLLLT
jgi:hypothetical protein